MKHFTQEKRIKLELLLKLNYSQQKIAKILWVNQSTISREIKRNWSEIRKSYKADIANKKSLKRKKDKYSNFKYWYNDKDIFNEIINDLKNWFSPEQIEWRRKLLWLKTVSHQSIYNYIKLDKKNWWDLYKLLRYQWKKYKWFWLKSKNKDEKIPNRDKIWIEYRPEIVNNKWRYWDWESDLVVSNKKWSWAVATFAERSSMYFCAVKVKSKSADEMLKATQKALGKLPKGLRRTMTHDNWREISKHEEIKKMLDIDVYCARPYKSCDRWLNEWMNRELRRFFPKWTDFSKITQKEIDNAINWLNNCPRKSLNYRTPKEVFDEQLKLCV